MICTVCGQEEERSEAELVCCRRCVQRLLFASDNEKVRVRDILREKERNEAADIIESFIEGEPYGELTGIRTGGDSRRRPITRAGYQKVNLRPAAKRARIAVRKARKQCSNLS